MSNGWPTAMPAMPPAVPAIKSTSGRESDPTRGSRRVVSASRRCSAREGSASPCGGSDEGGRRGTNGRRRRPPAEPAWRQTLVLRGPPRAHQGPCPTGEKGARSSRRRGGSTSGRGDERTMTFVGHGCAYRPASARPRPRTPLGGKGTTTFPSHLATAGSTVGSLPLADPS